ncbi:MAG: transglycosylase domain-containing protein [Proteobacteria bacterium]|nr:transglycosylase domain-containing protein [Pseudomonadota bacterium]
MQIHYRDLHLIWGGVRVEGVEISLPGIKSFGTVDFKLNLWPGPRFAELERIIVDRLQLKLQRPPSKSNQSSSQTASPMLKASLLNSSLTNKLLKHRISLELHRAEIFILDSNQDDLLHIKDLSSIFSAEGQLAELHIRELGYRGKEILQSLDGQLILDPERNSFPFSFTAQEQGSGPWQVQGSISQDFDMIEIRHKRSGLPLAWRAILHNFEPQESLELLFKLKVEGLRQGNNLEFDVMLASTNIKIRHHLLSSEAVGPLPFTIRALGSFDPERGSINIQKGLMYLLQSKGQAHVKSTFALHKLDLLAPSTVDPWRISWNLPETKCQTLLSILPISAFPLLQKFKLAGSIHMEAELEFLPKKGRALFLPASRQSFSCSIEQAPRLFTKTWIKKRLSGTESANMQENPSLKAFFSKDYVPIKNISEDFLRAVIAAEDARFWQHEGFQTESLIAAMQANIKAGKVLFGGSTITMQMVKNLYLNHDKLLSRKLQELFLSWAMEQTLSKQEILEVYANIIEFGPGIFGINQASSAYFSKDPAQLTTAEAIFLASILPSPVRHFHESYCNGQLESLLQKRMFKVATGLAAMLNRQPVMADYETTLSKLHFTGQGSCRSETILSQRGMRTGKRSF